MSNVNNLIPNSKRTREELSAMGRKGAIKSAQTRRLHKEKVKIITVQNSVGDTLTVKARQLDLVYQALDALREELESEIKKELQERSGGSG